MLFNMRYQSFIFTALLSIAFPLFTSAKSHGPSSRRHHTLANRRRADMELHRRDQGSRATFFADGLGACGITNSPSDFIVALNSCEYDGGAHCFKMITIEYQGKQTQAQITDECPGCPCGGLDMSTGLFDFFADPSVGTFTMNWWYSDGSGAPSSSAKPSPTSKWVPPPSPTTSSSKWVDPSPWTSQTTSSTWSQSSSSLSSSSWSSSSRNSTTWSSHSSTGTSSSHTPTPTAANVPLIPENLDDMNSLLTELGKLVVQYGT